MWLPVECHDGSQCSPQSPLLFLKPFFLQDICFRCCLSRIHLSFLGRCLSHSYFCGFTWEWENIFRQWSWRDDTVNPCNDGLAPCFIMIGGFGCTCCAIAEKLLSHVSHDFTLLLYLCIDLRVCYIWATQNQNRIFNTAIPRTESVRLCTGNPSLVWFTCCLYHFQLIFWLVSTSLHPHTYHNWLNMTEYFYKQCSIFNDVSQKHEAINLRLPFLIYTVAESCVALFVRCPDSTEWTYMANHNSTGRGGVWGSYYSPTGWS